MEIVVLVFGVEVDGFWAQEGPGAFGAENTWSPRDLHTSIRSEFGTIGDSSNQGDVGRTRGTTRAWPDLRT